MGSILSEIAGSVASAPAAALKALSPTAAAKASDGVAYVSSKMPSLSLQGTARNTLIPGGSADIIVLEKVPLQNEGNSATSSPG